MCTCVGSWAPRPSSSTPPSAHSSRCRTGGLLAADEVSGARTVLNAAALTYVAGFIAALGQLLYFFALSWQ